MQMVLLYMVTAVTFFGLDYFGLRYLIRPVFVRHVGDLLVEGYRAGPAIVFYLFYIGGVVWFVSLPALREGSVGQAFMNGALLGAIAYGTYEFTNYATLRDWSATQVVVDTLWGGLLTGVSAWAGVLATRAVFPA